MLGCAFLPWLSAALLFSRHGTRITCAVLLGLVLIPYIPVLTRLDVEVLVFSAVSFAGNMKFPPAPPIWVIVGPALRLAAILSMVGMVFDGRLALHRPGVAR